MAGSFTRTFSTEILDYIFGDAGFTLQGDRTLALYTGDPGATVTTGTAGEPSGGAYAQQTITFNAATLSGDIGKITNSGEITFPQATADYFSGTSVGGWAIFAATAPSNAGLMHGTFTTAKPVLTGDTAKILDDGIELTLD